MDLFYWVTTGIKILLVVVVLIHVAPIMAWVERRGSALMQNRLGPNRIGPFGLLQSLADGIKFAFKEAHIPGQVDKFYYQLAPVVSLIPALMTFAVIPFAGPIMIGDQVLTFQITDLNVGVLYILSVASLGVYGIIMGGWASNNKYALLGSLRSSSQMISYELSMGLSIVGIVMVYSSVHLGDIVWGQAVRWAVPFTPLMIPKWGIFVQPVGFIIFLTAAFAETNRLPFDLPEGESEIVAGYHLEYGALRFAVFMMAEYINMFVASALMATLYFGGFSGLHWVLPFLHLDGVILTLPVIGAQLNLHDWVRVLLEISAFGAKVGFFMWFYVWVRWTLPRFRYDQLMDLGWKVMLPLSLLNILWTGTAIYYGWF